ncbi:unnamed protein product [Leptidea sinapis]|uniref:SAM domain-containing protein n=1 Tax=Leptidea sinapis TaxID=189913 RepID=A0A5E4QWW3_9NEOP|nr:unnamed protein product [Leptidea sinapis]
MYPVGWCRAVRHRLEGPLQPPAAPRTTRKNQAKQIAKTVTLRPPNTTEESSQNSETGDTKSLSENGETKSLSPPTSVSEMSADVEQRPDADEPQSEVKMEVEPETPPSEETTPIDVPAENFPSEQIYKAESEDTPMLPADDTDSSGDKLIPRLVNTTVSLDILNSLDPENWTTADVEKFLTVNDCQPYCINFAHIDGPMLLQLTKDEIIELLEMKVGPSLKIFDLIQQLRCKIKQPQCRLLGSFK